MFSHQTPLVVKQKAALPLRAIAGKFDLLIPGRYQREVHHVVPKISQDFTQDSSTLCSIMPLSMVQPLALLLFHLIICDVFVLFFVVECSFLSNQGHKVKKKHNIPMWFLASFCYF
jgi:hypothetical protein